MCLFSLLASVCYGLYSPSDDVYDLNPNNFDKMVTESHFVWIVEFYAPWYVWTPDVHGIILIIPCN